MYGGILGWVLYEATKKQAERKRFRLTLAKELRARLAEHTIGVALNVAETQSLIEELEQDT